MENTLNILVVDDDEIDRMAVRRALTKVGVNMEFTEASDCTGAITRLKHQSFDCIFLDYGLPDQDGLELVKDVRSLGVKVPLIVLTGQGDEHIAVELMKAGASDYLSKSHVSPENLWQRLSNALRVHRAEMRASLANRKLRESNELLTRKNQKLEQQRRQIELQNQKLQEASHLKSQFLATMSHELRTPMNAVMGFSQMLLLQSHGSLDEQQQDMIERIFNNGQNLLLLIDELLDFSKIEAGHLELKLESFDLMELVQVTTEEIRSLALGKELILQVKTDLKNPLVYADRGCLRRILINLLSNAIKFTKAGQVWVKVWEPKEDQVAIAVEDTGVGISPENIKIIFEAFRQVDQVLTRKHSGTGLGLAIADSLVRMMKGQIRVESELGKGSLFQVELPRRVE
ncbi:MAG: ATP-binding protein [Spirulinaceae cyanobacterium]